MTSISWSRQLGRAPPCLEQADEVPARERMCFRKRLSRTGGGPAARIALVGRLGGTCLAQVDFCP